MIYSLTWLPAVLETAGLKVATIDGWESRGRGDVEQIVGVMCHHTVGPKNGNMPSLGTLIQGRGDLPGPLSQLGLGRDGTFYVIAAGKCNHAGAGTWKGVNNGNANFIGIEGENTGVPDDSPWPEVQMNAYQRGVAAILRHIGTSADFCAGHKEYASPSGRKNDPDFDMNAFRVAVKAILDGTAPSPTLIPATEPPSIEGLASGRPTLRRGATGDLVKLIQQKSALGVIDGVFGAKTESAVRGLQRTHGLVPDGIVGPKTWTILDMLPG
jgi:N-acetylmuramoyl-L-alanine amidase/Putative peptidoglycan binding domain